jgi:hypothetical protein
MGTKNIDDFYLSFARVCQEHAFATRIRIGTSRDNQRNGNWKCLMGKKHIEDFCVNFARACQDHTFVARIQTGTPKDNQWNGNGKCLIGKKHKRLLCDFCERLPGSRFCCQDLNWDPKGKPKE